MSDNPESDRKIRHEPRMWEYQIFSPEQLERNRTRLEGREQPGEIKMTAGAILLLALLELLNSLSNPEGSGIEGQEK